MKPYSLLFAILFALVLLIGCKSTGQRALQNGRYSESCEQAISKLSSSPNNKKATDALRQAYPLAVMFTDKEVERLERSGAYDKDVQIYELYSTMSSLGYKILKCPAAKDVIPNANFYTLELSDAAEKAAEFYYMAANNYFGIGSKKNYREAYNAYLMASQIRYDYKGSAQKAEEAKRLGTLNVVVEQVPVDRRFAINTDFFVANLFKAFPNREFFAMYSPEQAERAKLKPDLILQLVFSDFAMGARRETNNTREVSRDSVVVGTYTDKRGNKCDVYGTVKAEITLTQVEMVAQGMLSVNTIEFASGQTVEQKNFPGAFTWTDFWASYNGDDRALTDEEFASCKRKPAPLPAPQDLFMLVSKPMSTALNSYVNTLIKQN